MVSSILIDREAEQRVLQAAFTAAHRGDPQLILVHGRRRVGKTFLLSHMAQRQPRAVFFAATQQSERVELDRFAEALERGLGGEIGALLGGGFATWEAALRFLAALSRDEPLLVVIDEATYLESSTPGFASIVQAWWDHLERPNQIQLVLTGSAIGALTRMVGADGPLRGRPTCDVRLDPVDLPAAAAFLPNLDPRSLVEAWAVCGGYPQHLLAWDQAASLEENLEVLAGSPGGQLLTSATDIVRESAGDAVGYTRVLGAIGRGRTRVSAIASEAAQRIEHPLGVLMSAGLVRRELPVGAPKGAHPAYGIDDLYLRFWYSVLYADEQLIAGGQGRAVLARRAPVIRAHIAHAFECAARAHAVRLVDAGELPEGSIVGRWWRTSGQQVEVDVLGLRGSHSSIVGEVKWNDSPASAGLAARLDRLLEAIPDPEPDIARAAWLAGGADDALRASGIPIFGAEDVAAAR